jgi:predicted sulfurtransferase
VYKKPSGVATYCTGGIRCEKGARWMQEALANEREESDAPVYALHGGIVAYQAWMEEEISTGRKRPEDSFFKGTNYVFDARGAIGNQKAVSTCHGCGEAEDRLGKCEVPGCHLVLVVCEACERTGGISCCVNCRDIRHGQGIAVRGVRICKCENEREKSLWGEEGAKLSRANKQSKKTSVMRR